MPKYAIMSDIHGNGDALKVVLEKCSEIGVDHYVSLGDIVGYNAEPSYCMRTVRALPLLCAVRGNHDEYASGENKEVDGFNPNAKIAVLWTRSQLSPEECEWLGQIPYRTTIPGANATLVHATLDSPENWGYIFDEHHAMDNFAYQFTQLCFCGHSHVPIAFVKKPLATGAERTVEELPEWGSIVGDFTKPEEASVEMKTGYKYLLNVGSIGQPRNQDPRASFAIYDSDNRVVTRYKLPYDIAAAQQKILDAKLPERLAQRLPLGR